ncbi:hypothetical protein FRC07_010886 [Ceratobasidium sp. 392]|nr:hypothetical protein FRC07_010886 [Ceratobasidium sp. 392]
MFTTQPTVHVLHPVASSLCPITSESSRHKTYPDPNLATEEETELESKHKLDPRRDTIANRRADTLAVLARLNCVLKEPNPDEEQVKILMQLAVNISHGDCFLSSNSAGPSTLHGGPLSLHAGPSSHAGPLGSSANQPTSSKHAGHSSSSSLEDSSYGSDPDNDDKNPIIPNRSGLARYPGTCGKVASHAIPVLQLLMGHDAYQRVWKIAFKHIPYKECLDDLLHTIVSQVSNLQTKIKKQIQHVVFYLCHFLSGTSELVMAHNWQLVARLGHNTFHCCKLWLGKQQYQHRAFHHAICVAFFWFEYTFLIRDPNTLGRLHEEGLPLPAVAFVLTMMQECIEERDSGQHWAWDLNITTQQGQFDAHLQGLINYRTAAQDRMAGFQVKWFCDGLKYANVRVHRDAEDDQHFCQSITQLEDVLPDGASKSGSDADPNPEDGSKDEVEQHFTTLAKGKWSKY